MKPGHTGIKRLVKATGYSWNVIKACFKNEVAFRQEIIMLVILTPLAIWLADTAVEFILLVGVIILLLIVELLNTAIEMVVDRHGKEWHELSGLAKDMGSAAAFITILLAILVWLTIIASKINWGFI